MGGDFVPITQETVGNLRHFDLSQLSKREEGGWGWGVGATGISQWRLNMP